MALSQGDKVVNICVHDWANFSYDNAMALQSVGIDCQSYKIHPHVFHYDNESERIRFGQVRRICRRADVIQIFHSDDSIYKMVQNLGKKIIVWHTGTKYRQNPDLYNGYFNKCKIVVALGEFIEIAPEGTTYLVGAIDTEKYKTKYRPGKEIVIRHHPSNASVKGTADIVSMIKRYKTKKKFHFRWTDDRRILDHPLQMKRLDDCDVYIEMMANHQLNKKYGSWGISTLEAACFGKIIITNHSTVDIYKNVYGTPELQIIRDSKDLTRAIDYINSLTINDRKQLMSKTREWVVKNHGYKASGEMLIKML